MRVPAAAEKGIWGLIRSCIAAGGHLRLGAEALVDALKPAPTTAARAPASQLPLWIEPPGGLPSLPWRARADFTFHCARLACSGVRAQECVTRQAKTDQQRSKHEHWGKRDTRRGVASECPNCDSRTCAQGAAVRAWLDPDGQVSWEGAGPNGRFEPSRADAPEQRAARCRTEGVGRAGT